MAVVSTSAFYRRATSDMASLRERADSLQASLTSGSKLSRASDDPLAAARLRALSRAQTFAKIDSTAAARANADLVLTDQALGATANVIIRAKELATQAGNATLTPSQRSSIGQQIAMLGEEAFAIANSRDSTGNALFGGEKAGAAYTGNSTAPVYAGTAQPGKIDLSEGQSLDRGLTGPQVFSFTAGGNQTTLFATLNSLATALQGGAADPAAAARQSLDTLSAGLSQVTTSQTIIGSRMAWVETLQEQDVQRGELRATEQADVGGADIGETISNLQQITTVLQASQASFVKIANLSLFDLLR